MRTIKKLPHPKHFYNALFKNFLFAFLIIMFSLLIGIWGYCYFYDLGWIDGLLNASMILTGMGPVDPAPTNAAKIFASLYALYSGVAFLTSVAVLFGPILHRFMHKLRLDIEE